MPEEPIKTWDGKPVSIEPPHGATVVVYRRSGTDCEYLILHRAHRGIDYEGDWAWTPPSGARLPREAIDNCAKRELKEETGLDLIPQQIDFGDNNWTIYVAEADSDCEIILDAEHDRYEWLSLHEATARCQPEIVSQSLNATGHHIKKELNL